MIAPRLRQTSSNSASASYSCLPLFCADSRVHTQSLDARQAVTAGCWLACSLKAFVEQRAAICSKTSLYLYLYKTPAETYRAPHSTLQGQILQRLPSTQDCSRIHCTDRRSRSYWARRGLHLWVCTPTIPTCYPMPKSVRLPFCSLSKICPGFEAVHSGLQAAVRRSGAFL